MNSAFLWGSFSSVLSMKLRCKSAYKCILFIAYVDYMSLRLPGCFDLKNIRVGVLY
jgi:hypothetical protein